MDEPDIQTQNQAPEDNAFSRLDFLFSQIPDHIYDWLFSEQAATNVTALAKRFSLDQIQTVQLARLTGLAILKDISLAEMTLEIKKSLALDETITRQLAIATALAQFLPIRDHLVGVEDFIRQMGGSLPDPLPPLLKAARLAYQKTDVLNNSPTPAAQQPTVAQKTLRQLAQSNKDALNQNLTARPIRIADFDQPVRPTIKNWLVDYVKIKGAGHHELIERSDYLFNNPNAKTLSEEERALVSAILSAYDNDSSLPVREADQTILLERLTEPITSGASPRDNSRKNEEPRAAAPPRPNEGNSGYREPISPEDLSGPLKQPQPNRPVPRLSGNIIDLKDLE